MLKQVVVDDRIVERFEDKVFMSPNGCWEWLGAKEPTGYGRFKLNGRAEMAHRASVQIYSGILPTGFDVHHKCENRGCVNPDHLEVLSRKQHWNRSPLMKEKSLAFGEYARQNRRYIGPAGTSWCSGCQDFLPREEFHQCKSRWDGLRMYCRTCRKKQNYHI